MADFERKTFEGGWGPDYDAVNAPPGVLLRADNLILDELGALVVRQGTDRYAVLADLDVHSLFTVVRSNTRIRYAGAGAKVYRDAVDLGVTFAGSGDIQFGSYMGQTFMGRGSTNKKDDGSNVRTWGISMTGTAPSVSAAVPGDSHEFASWAETDTAEHEVNEDDGNGPDYNQDQNGVDNEALQLGPDPGTGRAIVTQTFPTPVDLDLLDGGREATDDDYISFFFFADNPQSVVKVGLQIDVNDGLFASDFFLKEWLGQGVDGPDGTVANPGDSSTGGGGGIIDPGPGEPPLI